MKVLSRRTRNIIVLSVIGVLVLAIVGISIFSAVTVSKYKKRINKDKAVIASANNTISDYEAEKGEMQSTIDSIKSENDKLKEDNASLQKQLVELAAKKKAAAEAKRLEQQKLQADLAKQRTQNIISLLSLPKTEQQSALPNVCYLTFDDGPSKNTPAILDILKRYNIKATFFVIGSGNLSLLPRMKSEGHTIGLHADNHNYAVIYKNVESYLTDLQAISQKVESLTGEKTSVMRFPGGGSNEISRKYCVGIMSELTKLLPDMGYSYFDWNVSSGDAEKSVVPTATIINNTLSMAKSKDSICVLMHDASAKTTTVEALPSIIEGLCNMGFRFEAITPQTNGYHHTVHN